MIHSVDFHAVTGPGGGAVVTQTRPGEREAFTFKALNPGLYVYHCATPMVAEHISNGMYGLILVEPEGGLPPVDREFYVMQGEIYTDRHVRRARHARRSAWKSCWMRQPEYFVFNGAVGALTDEHPLQGQGRRDGAHLLRRRRPELHLLVPRDRRDLRPGLRPGLADHRAR